MDELKLKLSTKFMRGMVAKLISKAIRKNLGYEVDIRIDEVSVETINGRLHFHMNADAEIDNDEFVKIIKSAGLD